jgi:hypothetical protein
MSAHSDLTTFDSMMKGLYPERPEGMPEWARKAWAERAELERTGQRVRVEQHLDNCGGPCREVGPASLVHDLVHHDCCSVCGAHGELILRIESGALPLVLQRSDARHYVRTEMVPCWAAWCYMWRHITELRARGFAADRVMFESEVSE